MDSLCFLQNEKQTYFSGIIFMINFMDFFFLNEIISANNPGRIHKFFFIYKYLSAQPISQLKICLISNVSKSYYTHLSSESMNNYSIYSALFLLK